MAMGLVKFDKSEEFFFFWFLVLHRTIPRFSTHNSKILRSRICSLQWLLMAATRVLRKQREWMRFHCEALWELSLGQADAGLGTRPEGEAKSIEILGFRLAWNPEVQRKFTVPSTMRNDAKLHELHDFHARFVAPPLLHSSAEWIEDLTWKFRSGLSILFFVLQMTPWGDVVGSWSVEASASEWVNSTHFGFLGMPCSGAFAQVVVL